MWESLFSYGQPDGSSPPAYAMPGYGDQLNIQQHALPYYSKGGQVGGYQPLELGANLPTAMLGLEGLGTLGGLWGSFQSTKLAKDAFNFQKGMTEKNYANQIKSYNTALTDRATTRGFVQGDSSAETQQYINDNKL